MNKIIFSMLVFMIFSNLFAKTYYVSTGGSDLNNGTSDNSPFASISKALSMVIPGDYIYVRGGTYYYSASLLISKSGTLTDSCFLFSFPNERVILDFSGTTAGTRGVNLTGSYWRVRGFEIKKAGHDGMYVYTGGNNVIELCSFYENQNVGLRLGGGTHDNRIINCDAYLNADPPDYGDADGFACALNVGTSNYFYGCRSWLNSDDGFDGYLRGADDVSTIYENCWAWRNGYLRDGTDPGPQANGNGFKMGGSDEPRLLMHNCILRNCLAFDNKSRGFDQNANRGNMILYNCTGYRNVGNNYGISSSVATGKIVEVKNCIAVDGKVSLGSFVVQSKNSWMSPFSVTPSDFVSLDTTGVAGRRKTNDRLPDLSFVHLVPGSDLIDSGDKLGIPYSGSAPDLGAFEYNPSGTTSIDHELKNSNCIQIRLSQNPVNESIELFVDMPSPGKLSCNMYDLMGREVWSSDKNPLTANQGRIDAQISHLMNATYILKISDSKSFQQSVKIIKY